MRHSNVTTDTTQVTSLFGSGYVPERREGRKQARENSHTCMWIAAGAVLAIGISAAAAITMNRVSVADYTAASQPANLYQGPFGGGFEDAVY
jgi:hypothetical protein